MEAVDFAAMQRIVLQGQKQRLMIVEKYFHWVENDPN